MRRPAARWVWAAGGAGFSPIAPGTCGSAVGFLVAWLLRGWMWGGAGGALLCAAACVPLGALAERALGRKDPSEFVLDEVAGFLVAVAFLPFSWLAWGAAFAAFRVVDAAKPPPLGRIQSLPGGWGILADDLLAGLVANGIARLVILWA